MTALLKIDSRRPDDGALAEALAVLRAGGIIAYPTETFYGLGVDARQEAAVEKIFAVKGRNARNPVSVIVSAAEEAALLAGAMPEAAQVLMKKFWPGPLTLVFAAALWVSPQLTGGSGKIGVRISSHVVAACLARGIAGPLTATSANVSGGPECTTAEEVIRIFGNRLDAVIDGGPTPGGLGSTVLDVTVNPPEVLRQGVVPKADILAAIDIFSR
jgi:L-threonylcarbamoyladenylate synthase